MLRNNTVQPIRLPPTTGTRERSDSKSNRDIEKNFQGKDLRRYIYLTRFGFKKLPELKAPVNPRGREFFVHHLATQFKKRRENWLTCYNMQGGGSLNHDAQEIVHSQIKLHLTELRNCAETAAQTQKYASYDETVSSLVDSIYELLKKDIYDTEIPRTEASSEKVIDFYWRHKKDESKSHQPIKEYLKKHIVECIEYNIEKRSERAKLPLRERLWFKTKNFPPYRDPVLKDYTKYDAIYTHFRQALFDPLEKKVEYSFTEGDAKLPTHETEQQEKAQEEARYVTKVKVTCEENSFTCEWYEHQGKKSYTFSEDDINSILGDRAKDCLTAINNKKFLDLQKYLFEFEATLGIRKPLNPDWSSYQDKFFFLSPPHESVVMGWRKWALPTHSEAFFEFHRKNASRSKPGVKRAAVMVGAGFLEGVSGIFLSRVIKRLIDGGLYLDKYRSRKAYQRDLECVIDGVLTQIYEQENPGQKPSPKALAALAERIHAEQDRLAEKEKAMAEKVLAATKAREEKSRRADRLKRRNTVHTRHKLTVDVGSDDKRSFRPEDSPSGQHTSLSVPLGVGNGHGSSGATIIASLQVLTHDSFDASIGDPSSLSAAPASPSVRHETPSTRQRHSPIPLSFYGRELTYMKKEDDRPLLKRKGRGGRQALPPLAPSR